MKKLILGFLMSVLCIGVIGCGSTEKKLYEKYKTLIDALEKDDYSTAIEEIHAMNQTNNMQEATYGEWFPMPYDVEEGFQSIAMYKDGTCIINGSDTYTWSLDHIWDNAIEFGIHTEAKKEYLIRVYTNPDMGYHYMYLERVNGAATSEMIATFYKADEYTIVDITLDNWKDYFEPFETIYTFKTSVGKFSSFNVDHGYKLKDEYQDRIRTDISQVNYDNTYTTIRGLCTVDIETETYELGEIKSADTGGGVLDTAMTSHYLGNDKYSYRFIYSSIYVDELPEDEVIYNIDFEMTRIEGQLFLLNKVKNK